MGKTKKRIRTKIMVSFLILVVALLLVVGTVSQISLLRMSNLSVDSNEKISSQASDLSARMLLDLATSDAQLLAKRQAENINDHLTTIKSSVQQLADYMTYIYENPDAFVEGTIPTVAEVMDAGYDGSEPVMTWIPAHDVRDSDITRERGMLANTYPVYKNLMALYPEITAIYACTKSGLNIGYDTSAAAKASFTEFEGREAVWYTSALEKNGPSFSETYSDSIGRGLTITVSAPFYRNGTLMGVVGLDMLLESINTEILNTVIGETGYAMLFSAEGAPITAPNYEDGREATHYLGSSSSAVLSQLAAGEDGLNRTTINGREFYLVSDRVDVTDWAVIFALPVSEITAPAVEVSDTINAIGADVKDDASLSMSLFAVISVALLILSVGVAILITLRVSASITKPIVKLDDDIIKLGDGNFDYKCDITTGDEIQELSLTFERMSRELKNYMDNLSRVTADKERIATELNVATQIQASMLPCIFPPFPERHEFDIFASMRPAKEVGGDFYDLFLVDDRHLAVVIADVSGKGVPAALFMVIAKTLIKNHSQMGKSPAETFTAANTQLCETNDAGMFVTGWMAMLDLDTGLLTYANAGHNHPLLKQNGKFSWLKSRAGFVLAGMDGVKYCDNTVQLSKGDILYLYTDGVTEALNREKELYSDPRLESELNTEKALSCNPEELVEHMKKSVSDFADGAEQADDITMLALMYN